MGLLGALVATIGAGIAGHALGAPGDQILQAAIGGFLSGAGIALGWASRFEWGPRCC